MASHNYKLYLYFIIARASRALSNIASDYAVNKLRKYDFLPGQSGCLPHFLLCFPSYSSSPFFLSLPSLACLILLLLLLATLELCSSWRHFRARWRAPLLLLDEWAGGVPRCLCWHLLALGRSSSSSVGPVVPVGSAAAAVEPVFVFFNLLHGESDVN